MEKISYTHLLLLIGFIAVVFFLAAKYVDHSLAAVQSALDEKITTERQALMIAAEALYRSRNDETIRPYVRDCSTAHRNEFDGYLNRLHQLPKTELDRVELLFEACASFFADQKAALLANFSRDYHSYLTTVALYEAIDERDPLVIEQEDWELFLQFQEQLTQLLSEQVTIQQEIIVLLQSGASVGDDTVRSQMEQAQEVAQSATVISRQIDSVYTRLKKGS